VISSSGKLVVTVVDPKILFVAQVNQAIVSSPAVGVYDALHVHLSPNDGLQSGLGAIRHDFGVDSATALQDSKDRCFSVCSPSAPSPDAPGTEVGFVNFDLSFKGRLLLTQLGDSLLYQCEVAVNSVPVETSELSDFGGIQIK